MSYDYALEEDKNNAETFIFLYSSIFSAREGLRKIDSILKIVVA